MTTLSILQTYAGKHIPAINLLKLFSPDEWEEFVEEWLTTKKDVYHSSERLGGAGDQGRDVVGYITDPKLDSYRWDNYQCKHYAKPLMPSDIWTEFGKLCYFTYKKDFPVPDNYYFVAPHGIGTSLSNLLKNDKLLKSELKNNWDVYCKSRITAKSEIKLEGGFLKYIDDFDFTIFDKVRAIDLIEEHKKTPYHIARFGGGLPPRPELSSIPENISKNELPYITQLLKSYSTESEITYKNISNLPVGKKYHNHLCRSRESFHTAEQLKNFSRDILPPDVFESLKEEIYSGAIDIVEDDHDNAFLKIKEVEKEVRRIAITSNPLVLCSTGKDRVGICHHLVNEDRLNWLGDDNE